MEVDTMETIFDFSTNVIPLIIKEIESAEKYVRIAIFQLHNQSVLEALDNKLRKGVIVEIATLPYDSINKDIAPRLSQSLDNWRETVPKSTSSNGT
jgi:hypothetical protein